MTLDTDFWARFEASAGCLNTAVNDLPFLPKKTGRKILDGFSVSLRVAPGCTPEHHFDVANMEPLCQGLSGHASFQRAAWRTAVLAACEEMAGHLRTLHAALVAVPGFARTKVLGVDLAPRKTAPILWLSEQGHAATSVRPGHDVLDGTAARLFAQALRLDTSVHHRVWLLSVAQQGWGNINEDYGFGSSGRMAIHQRAATLKDALLLARIRHPHLFSDLRLHTMQAAQLIPESELALAIDACATT